MGLTGCQSAPAPYLHAARTNMQHWQHGGNSATRSGSYAVLNQAAPHFSTVNLKEVSTA